jgi:hypothetical protein
MGKKRRFTGRSRRSWREKLDPEFASFPVDSDSPRRLEKWSNCMLPKGEIIVSTGWSGRPFGLPHAGICHYVGFCRMFGRWICFNDHSVTDVDQEEAIENTGSGQQPTDIDAMKASSGTGAGQETWETREINHPFAFPENLCNLEGHCQ